MQELCSTLAGVAHFGHRFSAFWLSRGPVTFSLLFVFKIRMPTQDEFMKSLVLQLPPSVYQRTGASAMLPKLLQILNPEDLRCVQFLRSGRVCVLFHEEADRDHFLSEGMRDDQDIPVTRDAEKVMCSISVIVIYHMKSPVMMSLTSSLLLVDRSVAAETRNLCDGNCVLKMVLKEDLPYFISVCEYQCRVWYRGQPIQCFVCRQLGHRAQSCPLSGRCCYCHQVSHMVRDCVQAWDPTPPAVSADVDESSVSDSGTIIADEPSVPDSDPIRITTEPSDKLSLKDKLPVPDPVHLLETLLKLRTLLKFRINRLMCQCLSPRPPVTAKMFCARLSKTFQPHGFPDFDDISDKERDSKAKAHLRALIKAVFNSKDIDVISDDL